jgi:hypothetical protein
MSNNTMRLALAFALAAICANTASAQTNWTVGKHWNFVYFAQHIGRLPSHGTMMHDHALVADQQWGMRQAQFADKATCVSLRGLAVLAETTNHVEHGNISACTYDTYWKPER